MSTLSKDIRVLEHLRGHAAEATDLWKKKALMILDKAFLT